MCVAAFCLRIDRRHKKAAILEKDRRLVMRWLVFT